MKIEIEHTPGPWKYDPYWSLIMAGQSEIAAVHAAIQAGEKRKRLDEAHANAQLISAAPDLLQACRAALEMFNEQMFIWGKDDDQKVCHMTKALFQAIQKTKIKS